MSDGWLFCWGWIVTGWGTQGICRTSHRPFGYGNFSSNSDSPAVKSKVSLHTIEALSYKKSGSSSLPRKLKYHKSVIYSSMHGNTMIGMFYPMILSLPLMYIFNIYFM